MSQQYTPLSSPKDQDPAGPRVGSDLCLQTQYCKLQDCSFLPSRVCPFMDECGLEVCAGFLVGRASACPLVGGVGSWPSGVPGHVNGHVSRQKWAQKVFRQPVC